MVNFLQYVLLGIMLAAPVGPASLAVIQNGLRGGFWRAWRTGIGVTLADASMLLVVYFGLAAVMSAATGISGLSQNVALGKMCEGAFRIEL